MKKTDLYDVAVKLLGIYLFVSALNSLKDIVFALVAGFSSQTFNDLWPLLSIGLASFGIMLLISWVLIFKTRHLLNIISSPEDKHELLDPSLSKQSVYEIALTLLGLCLFAFTVPELAFKLKVQVQMVQNNIPVNPVDAGFAFVGTIKLILGFFALLYSRSIAGWLSRSR